MALIECFVPPALQPGGSADQLWCVAPTCNPCEPPRRRYADCDYIDITPGVSKTFIRMLHSRQNPQQFDAQRSRIYIEIKRRGCETAIACYDAFQRTLEGYVGFYWDSTFTEACEGLYVGDVYIDCTYCFSVLFRRPRCELIVDSCYNEYLAETCGDGECSMLETVGEGVIGGLDCESAPDASQCGVAAPYFETSDPSTPESTEPNCNLSCTPAFSIAGDDIIGSI